MEAMILTDVGLWLGATPLAGASNQVALDLGNDELDGTTLAADERGIVLGGRSVQLEASGYYDPDLDGAIDQALEVADGNLVTCAPVGTEVGSPAFTFEAAVADLSRAGAWGEPATFDLSAVAAQGASVVRGQVAHYQEGVGTGTITGETIDLGVPLPGRFVAVGLHVLKAAGTSPRLRLKVQSSSTSDFASPVVRLELPVQIGTGWELGSVAAGTDRFWRVVVQTEGNAPVIDFLAVLGFADVALQGPDPAPVYDFQPAAGQWGGYTLARPSAASRLDLDGDGDLDAAANDQSRIITAGDKAGSMLIEGARTNYFANNTFAGAELGGRVFGTGINASANGTVGLNLEVAGKGTCPVLGIPYLDLRLVGTSTSGGEFIFLTSTTHIAAAAGQVWATGAYLSVVAGALGRGVVRARTRYVTTVGSVLRHSSEITADLDGTPRWFAPPPLTTTDTAGDEIRPTFAIAGYLAGDPVDVTFRISGIIAERSEFIPPGVILTSVAAVTTAADVVTRPCTADEVQKGTILIEFESPAVTAADYGTSQLWTYNTDTANGPRLALRYTLGASSRAAFLYSRGSLQTSLGTATYMQAPGLQRIAATWGPDGWAFAHNGALLDSSALPIDLPSGSTLETIGNSLAGAPPRYIKRVRRFAEPLALDRLLALTAI